MSSDTPLIEYLIIGTHTVTWLILLLLKAFDVPLQVITSIDPADVIVALPFVYLLGMLFDDLSFRLLDGMRKKIRNKIYISEVYKDEVIAFASEQLYTAYEARVRRIRVIGAAIFNWPLIGGAALLYIDLANWIQTTSVISFSLLLCLLSYLSWMNLYARAYKFRKNACDIIFGKEKELRQPILHK